MAENIFINKGNIQKERRNKLNGRQGMVFWMFGLSGSGKSTISKLTEEKLTAKGVLCFRLDGDNIRSGLKSDLEFSKKDRFANIRKAAETAKIFANVGVIVLASFITPLKENREAAKSVLGNFYRGVHIKCNLDICINRDPKGLYKKAINGEIEKSTGVLAPFEQPEDNILVIDTVLKNEGECVLILMRYILEETE